jgi:hypothetical protein
LGRYDSTLLNSFVKYITELHDCKDKAVRFRVCQIASRLLHTLPDEAELDEQWFDAIQFVTPSTIYPPPPTSLCFSFPVLAFLVLGRVGSDAIAF